VTDADGEIVAAGMRQRSTASASASARATGRISVSAKASVEEADGVVVSGWRSRGELTLPWSSSARGWG
jgi:hypothetical protein